MLCDYPLNNDSILELNLTKVKNIECLITLLTVLTDVNGLWKGKKYKLTHSLDVSRKENISFSYFTMLKHNRNSM